MADSDTNADILKVSVLGKQSIHCGFHLIPYIVQTVLSTLPSSTYVLVTDTNVANYHLASFQSEFDNRLPKVGARFLFHLIAPGETTKSREGKADVEDFLLVNKCTRDTVILALGGGVIGDLVGFVAATFMRGVRLVQIPTTLLAMVDSSVGGKTAIDTSHGKNLIGAVWQPEYIFIDAAFIETLPVREFSNGMAEVIKTAAIWNESEFNSLESRSVEIFAAIQAPSRNNSGRTRDTRSPAQEILLSVIVGSISVKAHIVTIDERETGLRNLVNFGHSIGHAIEAILTPSILHGECISVGMVLEAELSRQMGILGQVGVGRLVRCLKAYNLPVSLSDTRIANLDAAKLLTVDRILDIMKIDKKNVGSEKKIVILSRIGATYEPKATVVPDKLIAKTLSESVRIVAGVPSRNPVRMATPGSKSISNRALVLAALGSGTCRIKNLLHSDDTQVMMIALLELKGARFSWEDGGETLVVHGGRGSLSVPADGKEIYLGNAGTAARFLTTVCTLAQLTHLQPGSTTITGNARMKQRPIGPLVDALSSNGCNIQYLEAQGCLPLAISPNGLKGLTIQLAASVSSQYVSSILLCAPYAQEPVTLELTGGQVISQPYIDMTVAMMKTFGIEVVRKLDEVTGKPLDIYEIPKGVYLNPAEYSIESDASSATYPLAIAALTGTSCTIHNIGSDSLQGDAKFAKAVLEKMGCEVTQTTSETTVVGPQGHPLKGIEEIDMEEMTDAFLTASVLAAVAKGKTRIVGIANQRVKECNRIRAMVDELAKFGVQANELDDGLEICGKPVLELKRGVSVHCYDDHRVAMSFSVLGTVIEDTIIEEKRCVEKTWPNWWDDLENKIGLNVEGIELANAKSSSASCISAPDIPAPVVLIGMRGSGKTLIGGLAASALSWPSIDADEYFEKKNQIGVREFVHQHGWPAFRAAETKILEELLSLPSNRPHVISLGGGVVETPAARDLLNAYAMKGGPVVYVMRPITEVLSYLACESARPEYGEPIEDVFHRREPWYKSCSNYEFTNRAGSDSNSLEGMKNTRNEVRRFFRHVTGVEANLAALTRNSYFLSLTYPDVTIALDRIEQLTSGVDAVELRVDLLQPPNHVRAPSASYIPPTIYVADQLSALRRSTSLPIVFTVRTVSQGGAFPDAAESEAFELFDLALRRGVEYLDVEVSWSDRKIRDLSARKGSSKIIASWHDWSGNMHWNSQLVKEKYNLANELGDIIKIVGKANSMQDNLELRDFVNQSANNLPNAKPMIAINMGTEGQLSRVLNTTLTPVTHPLLPAMAAPGQLSLAQIHQTLHLIGQLPSRKFFLFGNPIAESMSPTIHNTGFEVLRLPHVYHLLETADVGEEIKATVQSHDFGGASVTIPFKLDVIPLLDKLSAAAEAIGAVNTIIPISQSPGNTVTLYGDNTDWLGICAVVRAKLPPSEVTVPSALVIGAGGTARAAIYALHDLGAQTIYLYNRTRSKAEALVRVFPSVRLVVLDTLQGEEGLLLPNGGVQPSVIISTVPASAMTTTTGDVDEREKLFIPRAAFSPEGGVMVDMAYRPAETPLLKLAREAPGGRWKTVQGLEVLLEQGYAQFERWTGRRCPRTEVSEKVWERYRCNEG